MTKRRTDLPAPALRGDGPPVCGDDWPEMLSKFPVRGLGWPITFAFAARAISITLLVRNTDILRSLSL